MFPLHIHFFSKSHNNSIIRVTSFFTFRTNHIVHIKRTSYHNTTDIQCIIDCLDCTNSKWSIVWIPVTSLYKLPLISGNTGNHPLRDLHCSLVVYQIITGEFIHTDRKRSFSRMYFRTNLIYNSPVYSTFTLTFTIKMRYRSRKRIIQRYFYNWTPTVFC